jgi:hypothetical protein
MFKTRCLAKGLSLLPMVGCVHVKVDVGWATRAQLQAGIFYFAIRRRRRSGRINFNEPCPFQTDCWFIESYLTKSHCR